jgi:outer membrane protein assembly factor BamD
MHYFFLFFLFLNLTGCSDKDPESDNKETDAKILFLKGKRSLKEGDFLQSAKLFLEIEQQHPHSPILLQAELLAAYSFYEARQYDDAIDGFKAFITLHPAEKSVPYALYMLGQCYYDQVPLPDRDQKTTEKAISSFKELIQRFPDTSYGKDAYLKLDALYNHLSFLEMNVGRFYAQRGNCIAAITRFQNVVTHYKTTPQVEEALYRIIECSLSLGLLNEVKKAASVLFHNFPKSPWYKKTYALIKKEMPQLL